MKNKKTIIICDDDQGNLDVLTVILGEYYKIIPIFEHSQLQKVLNSKRPDLIIVDYSFGPEKSPSFIKQLKHDEATSNIPVILSSAANNGGNLTTGLDVVDFLPKPFDMNALLVLVRKHI